MPLNVTFDPTPSVSELDKDGASKPLSSREFARSIAPGDIIVLSWSK